MTHTIRLCLFRTILVVKLKFTVGGEGDYVMYVTSASFGADRNSPAIYVRAPVTR